MESRPQSALLFFIKTLITCYICYIEKIHIIYLQHEMLGKNAKHAESFESGKKV